MAPVEGDGQTDRTASAGGAPTIPEDEISRKNRQTLLERQSISVKRRFTTEMNTLKSFMSAYEKEFPTDSTPQSERQLEDAKDIVDLLDMVTDRYKNIVNIQNEIITCICTSIYLEDTDIDKEITKAQASLETYQTTYDTFKLDKDFSKIRDRVHIYIKLCKNRTNNSQVISSSISNVSKVPIFKPQPELKPQILGKECQLLEFTTWGKNFSSYIKSSSLPLPEGAINDNLRVNMDPSWYVELQEKGLDNNTTIEHL